MNTRKLHQGKLWAGPEAKSQASDRDSKPDQLYSPPDHRGLAGGTESPTCGQASLLEAVSQLVAVQLPLGFQAPWKLHSCLPIHTPALAALSIQGGVTLFGVEVAIAVTVGNGDDEEVFVGAALRGSQSLQGPVQLALAGALRHRPGFLPGCPQDLHLAPISHFGHMLLQAPMIVGAAGVEAVVGMFALILVCRPSEKGRG